MSGPDRLFNRQKRKVLRRRITAGEAAFGGVFVLVVIFSGLWVLAQRDNFDPGDRDITFETLAKDSTGEVLYETPLKRWVEPGTAPPGGTAAPALGVFPPDVIADGWALDGRVEVYDVDSLYEKIDGAAEQYIAFGFERLHYATFAHGDDAVSVELYDQGSFPNVLGLFAAQGGGRHEVMEKGDAFYYTTSVGAIGGYARWYFKIAGNRTGDTVRRGADRVLAAITRLPESDDAMPRAYRILRNGLGLGFGSLAYERVDVFQYDFLHDFWFGAIDGGAGSRYYVHAAADAAEAEATFDRLRREQDYEYGTVDADGTRVLMKHKYLGTFFTMEHDGRLVFGVDAAASRPDAESAHSRLREASRREQRQADTKA